ncbi:hypothetical protein EMIHUDRAFT_360171, partial [Emiliania huxleyi CCMP1516]|uniref:Uncharacterized protein n=2 Tax=Emiliania huxleyi TaxID=2903 RepID=A0A0D3I0A3_EMIH1
AAAAASRPMRCGTHARVGRPRGKLPPPPRPRPPLLDPLRERAVHPRALLPSGLCDSRPGPC